ncbi:MAG TPA: hypothetical protein VKZ53_05395 [Candidatus Angelobacter sp.]|nr:hypothetical protein [Candidatus Angelobacter sp.]
MKKLLRSLSLLACLVLMFSALPISAQTTQIQHGASLRDASVANASVPAGTHLSYSGGPVISNAHVIQVLYGPGSYNLQVAGSSSPTMGNFFNDILGTSSGYIDLLSQYGTNIAGGNQTIGNGTFGGLFQIVPSAANNGSTIDDSNIQAELLVQISAGHLPAAVLDAAGNVNTIYMIYFPPGKTISRTVNNQRTLSCQGFCAYHWTTSNTLNAKHLLYGVLPDMQAGSACATGCGTSNVFGNYTTVTSHELAEAITDADVGLGTHIAWTDQQMEVGDICNLQQGSYVANGTTYIIQLLFSNAVSNCALPPTTVPPNPVLSTNPSNVNSGQSATLSWTNESGDATSYQIFESFCNAASCSPSTTGSPMLIGTELGTVNSLSVLITRSALFQVKACNFAGCDTGSRLVGVSVSPTGPPIL